MTEPLKILILEDSATDAEIVQRLLKKENLHGEFSLAMNKEQYLLALDQFQPDVILADNSLPQFTGTEALEIIRRRSLLIPFILVTGTVSEEFAAGIIKLGADEYVLKDRLARLPAAIDAALKHRQTEKEKLEAQQKLIQSNERYEFVNKATQDTIWEWDFITKEGRWGEGIIKTFGYSENKLIYDENWLDEYVHPYDKEEVSRRLHTCIGSGIENWQYEFRFRCADDTYKYVYDRGFILYNDGGKPYRMIGSMTDVTEKKRLERELVEMLVKKQKLITETTIQAQEKERNELGRELHDNINQILATVKMYIGIAKAKEKISKDLIEQSYEYVNEAMEEIRKLSHSLVAPSLGDIGLKEALQELVEDANLLNGLHVQLLVDEKYYEKDIDKNKELMFYRIVQEQLNNITKYSKAKKVVITLKTDNENLVLSVTDNGVGFDSAQKSKGIGLKNISNRVEFYSGNVNIIAAPGKGCTLEVYIPANAK